MPKTNLKNLIKAGKYDLVNSNINDKNFPDFKNMPVDKVELVHFDKQMSSEEVIRELEDKGMRPANLKELLIFGKKNPDEQKKYSIVALGSVWQGWDGLRGVPCLWGGGGRRRLFLHWFDDGWGAGYRFTAVRQVASDTLPLSSCKNCRALEKKLERIKEIIE